MTVWEAIGVHGLEIVASVVMVVVTALVNKYIKNKDVADTLDSILGKGVAWAEEQGRKALNDGSPMTGDTKLELAAQFVLKELEDLGYPKLAEDKLIAYLEAKLHSERSNPSGAIASDPVVVSKKK